MGKVNSKSNMKNSYGSEQIYMVCFHWTTEKGMEPLGVLERGKESCAYGVNFDGSVIVGEAVSKTVYRQKKAFRWTADEGLKFLGILNSGQVSCAYGVNFDGSVIVGEATDDAVYNKARAFRWTADKGMETIEQLLSNKGVLPPGWVLNRAKAITPSGTVIVGYGESIRS